MGDGRGGGESAYPCRFQGIATSRKAEDESRSERIPRAGGVRDDINFHRLDGMTCAINKKVHPRCAPSAGHEGHTG